MKRRVTATHRIAGLAGVLAVVAVVAAVVPFISQTKSTSARLQNEIVQAAIANGGGVEDLSDLKSLISTTALTGGAIIDVDGTVEQHGLPREGVLLVASACPENAPQSAPTRIEPFHRGDYAIVGACIARPDGRRVVGVRSTRAFSNRGTTRSVIFLALVFGCLAGAVTVASVRRMLSPLAEMSEAARALGAGDTVSIEAPDEPEFRPLAEALMQLGAQIQAHQDDIEGRLVLQRQVGAVVAHEVRNPLQSITMLADLVAHEADPDFRQEILARIQQELGLIEVVVQRLVAGEGSLRLVLRETDVSAVIGGCLKMQGPRARETRVHLRARVLAEPVIDADAALLRRAIEDGVVTPARTRSRSTIATGAGGFTQVGL